MADLGQWRYIAQRLTGSGDMGEFIDFNVPLQNANLDEVLSGHNGLTGTISPEYMRLKTAPGRNGEPSKPLLDEWACAIWAEDPDGEIRGGGILTHSTFNESVWEIECTDLTAISIELPYTDANFWIDVDPMDLYRYLWLWIQSQPFSNLHIEIDDVHSPVRLGNTLIQHVEFDTEADPGEGEVTVTPVATYPNPFSNNAEWKAKGIKVMKAVGWTESVVDNALSKWLAKTNDNTGAPPLTQRENMIKNKVVEKIGYPPNPPPPKVDIPPTWVYVENPATPPPEQPVVWEYDAYKLAWYKDHDLSKVMDDLATETPFDWYMTHQWGEGPDGPEIKHRIRLGYPRIGRRLTDYRFVVGENIKVVPSVPRNGMAYADEVMVLGAGEGSAMVQGRAFRSYDNRIRKVAVISDPSIQTNQAAAVRAEQELASRFVVDDVANIILEDHPNAPMGSVQLGDDILIEGETGWIDLEVWCRVVGRSLQPDSGEAMTLTVIRSDRLP